MSLTRKDFWNNCSLSSPILFLKELSFLCKNSSALVLNNGSSSMVLDGEDVAREPVDVSYTGFK
eukprot:2243266-Ditylum_brightwellii.AAC.1